MESMLRTLGKLMTKTKAQSFIDYPLNEDNRDKICAVLIEFNLKITAVWIVSRPVNRTANSTFEHWTLKIQAPPALLSIDFMEHDKKGAFKLRQSFSDEKGLARFLHYKCKESGRYSKLQIKSSVTPVAIQGSKLQLHDHEPETLSRYMRSSSQTQPELTQAKIQKRVCDIADFVEMWSQDATYNVISCNCQHFAVDLYAFLVGSSYPHKARHAIASMDDACDMKKYKRMMRTQSGVFAAKYDLDQTSSQTLVKKPSDL